MPNDERHGVLVGWTSQNLGSNIMVELQTFDRSNWAEGATPDHTRIFMTCSQAAVLANHLLKVSGALPPTRRRKWLGPLFP